MEHGRTARLVGCWLSMPRRLQLARHAGAAAHEAQGTLTGHPPAHLRAHDALAAKEVVLPAVHVHAATLALQVGRCEAVEVSAR